MAKDPAFPFYAQDFLIGVMHMSFEDRGRYITLLAYQWDKGAIPKKRLGFLIDTTYENMSDELIEKFEDLGETIVNERLENEREKRANYKQKQSENGKKGGRPPKTSIKYKPKTKPITSQKKPLEDENENVIEIKGKGKGVGKPLGIDEDQTPTPEDQLLGDEVWFEQNILMRYENIPNEQFRKSLRQWSLKVIESGDDHKPIKQLRAGFKKWMGTWADNYKAGTYSTDKSAPASERFSTNWLKDLEKQKAGSI